MCEWVSLVSVNGAIALGEGGVRKYGGENVTLRVIRTESVVVAGVPLLRLAVVLMACASNLIRPASISKIPRKVCSQA